MITTPRPDGIYLNLPEADYHADTALSASGIKNLLQSPADYWFNSAHNPDRQDDDTDALTKGKLYHMAFFEPERIKAECAFKPDGMSFATKDGKAWRAENEGKTIIKAADWKEIDRAHKLAMQAGLFEHIADGFEPWKLDQNRSEVSIFWTDRSGFRCKCRVDHLAYDRSYDLKTFSNSMRKDVDTCIAHAIYYERYHIAAVWYLKLIEAAERMSMTDMLTGETKPQTLIDPDMEHHFWLVFQQTGNVPNLAMREIEHRDTDNAVNEYWRAAERAIDYATSTYAKYMNSYGPEKPWIAPLTPKAISDHEFAPWMLESNNV